MPRLFTPCTGRWRTAGSDPVPGQPQSWFIRKVITVTASAATVSTPTAHRERSLIDQATPAPTRVRAEAHTEDDRDDLAETEQDDGRPDTTAGNRCLWSAIVPPTHPTHFTAPQVPTPLLLLLA